jgi:hypothetical protein
MDKGTFRSGLSEPEVVEVGSKKRANTIYEEVTAALDDANKHEKDMSEMMLNQSSLLGPIINLRQGQTVYWLL